MNKKRIVIIVIAVALIAALAGYLAFTNKNKETNENTTSFEEAPTDMTESDEGELVERESNGIAFEEEDDEAVLEKVAVDVSDYYGEWEATSDMALYLYGSIDITVKENGTWEGEVTGEPLGGTWEDMGDHLHMNDTKAELFSFDLAFDKSGKLILIDTDSEDEVHTVLTKK